jgi:hypothetical protein
MNNLLTQAIAGEPISDADIEDALYKICDDVHSSCYEACPVFEKNGGPLRAEKPFEENRGCDCFKNGRAMLKFLRS